MIELLFAVAGVAVGAAGAAYRLRDPGESLLSAVRRAFGGGGPIKTPPR